MSDEVIKLVLDNQEKQQRQLDRLDRSMETVANAVEKLAVIDERMANDRDTLKRYGERLDEHAKRIWTLEITDAKNSWIHAIWGTATSKLITTLVTAAIGAACAYWGLK